MPFAIMRGDIFKRIKTYSKHLHPQDFVFADFNTGREGHYRKHIADYMHGGIDLGIEVVPMKSLERDVQWTVKL